MTSTTRSDAYKRSPNGTQTLRLASGQQTLLANPTKAQLMCELAQAREVHTKLTKHILELSVRITKG